MLTKRQRIAGWIGLDAERRRREAVVAQVTARLAAPRPSDFGTFSGAQSAAWSAHLARQLARNPGFFGKFGFDKSDGNDFGVITVDSTT